MVDKVDCCETAKDALHALFLTSHGRVCVQCVDQGNSPQNITQTEDYKAAFLGQTSQFFDGFAHRKRKTL